MNHPTNLIISLLAGSITAQAATFKDASKYLDTDGTLLGYINFEGDGQEIGTQLNAIYADATAAIPDMMPIPIDFNLLFNNLGFGSIQAMGISSKEIGNGVYANRSVTLLSGELTGLFAMYGKQNSPLTRFKAAEMAPADASGAMSGQIHLTALRDTATTVMMQVMGPMGKGMIDQQLQMVVPGTDIKVDEIIGGLKANPEMAAYAALAEKAADLLVSDFLKPAIGTMYFDENALVSESYASYSTKQAVMIIPAAIVGGISAGMAVPAFMKTKTSANEAMVKNNLRQIGIAAQMHFIEEGTTEVKVEALIGPDKFIESLEPVAGESYEGMIIRSTDTEISVTLENGDIISVDL